MNTEYIGDEKGTYPHVESGAVHIDGSTERKDERHDVPFYSQLFFRVLHIHRKRARGRTGSERNNHGFCHAAEKPDRAHMPHDRRHRGIHADRVDRAADSHSNNHGEQRQKNLRTILHDDR